MRQYNMFLHNHDVLYLKCCIFCFCANNILCYADLTTKCIQAQPEPLSQHCAGHHPVCGLLPGSRLVQALLPSDKPSGMWSTFSLATIVIHNIPSRT